MLNNVMDIVSCVLLIVAGFSVVITVGIFWYYIITIIFDKAVPQKLTDKELDEKTK